MAYTTFITIIARNARVTVTIRICYKELPALTVSACHPDGPRQLQNNTYQEKLSGHLDLDTERLHDN